MTHFGARAAFALFISLTLVACGGHQSRATPGAADSSVVYVDVRTPQEFAEGHVRGAVHIPYDQMAQRWRELEQYRDRPMVLYCRSGRRAGIALEVLKAHGFTRAQNGGGLNELAARNVPTER